jgi:dienelactone hydrolase
MHSAPIPRHRYPLRRGLFVDQAFDAYASLRYLSQLNFVDGARVAVIGQSMGGSSALYAVDRDLAAQYFNERFRAAIAYYPGCAIPAATNPGADRGGRRLELGRTLPSDGGTFTAG